LTITVRGEPDEKLPLEISGDEGQNDTLTVAVGPSGVSTVQVAVEPGRPGLHRWTVRTPSTEDAAHATAWVRPQSRLRVLVLTGPPSWEARYLVRALESSGGEVVVRQELGRDLAVTSDGTGAPQALSDLESFDVVVAVGAQPPSRSVLLDRWMAQQGGGLLTIDPGDEEALTFATSELAWSGPAELIPLPDADIDVRGVPVTTGAHVVGGAVAARQGTPDSFVMATTVGRGRALLSRLETWPWVLRGGVPDAHASYWTSVVEWLAGGLTDEVLLRGPRAQPLTAWVGELEGAVPSTVSVGQDSDVVELATAVEVATVAPGATTDTDDAAGGGSGVGVGSVRFVPVRVGAHPVFVDDAAPFDALVVHPGDDRLRWVEAALEVGGSGATILAADARVAPVGLPVGGSDRRTRAQFLLLAGLMAAGWSARRIRGLP
jgi:hypothetical protein